MTTSLSHLLFFSVVSKIWILKKNKKGKDFFFFFFGMCMEMGKLLMTIIDKGIIGEK